YAARLTALGRGHLCDATIGVFDRDARGLEALVGDGNAKRSSRICGSAERITIVVPTVGWVGRQRRLGGAAEGQDGEDGYDSFHGSEPRSKSNAEGRRGGAGGDERGALTLPLLGDDDVCND